MSECDNTGTAVPHITVKECPIIHGPNCDKIWRSLWLGNVTCVCECHGGIGSSDSN